MDYGPILIIAAYLAAIQLATRANAGAGLCSFVAVGIPYIVSLVVQWIIMGASSPLALASLFPLAGVVTFILQLIVSLFIFVKIRNDDGISATIGWSISGFVLIVMLIPFVVQKII